MKLIIRNLARSTTEEEVKALFQEYGTVQSCDLVSDKTTGESKGFAFVKMPKPGESKVAMKNLNNTTVARNKIRVKRATNKTECIGASKDMISEQSNNPLHGLTLVKVVTRLVEHYDWDGLAQRININCFKSDPSVKSSLKFLRNTQWARDKVEDLYISTFVKQPPMGNAK